MKFKNDDEMSKKKMRMMFFDKIFLKMIREKGERLIISFE